MTDDETIWLAVVVAFVIAGCIAWAFLSQKQTAAAIAAQGVYDYQSSHYLDCLRVASQESTAPSIAIEECKVIYPINSPTRTP